ncbi:DUF397 domain-containing protein [Actinocorallia aurea]
MERDWFKSSHSQGDNTDCVEASFTPTHRLLRDSKNPTGPVLTLGLTAYRAFLSALKSE